MTLATSRGAWLLWVILPYLAVATFVVGTIWRYRTDQVHWTTRSTQLLESRSLKIASPLFHFGLLAVIGGHVIGILVPQSFTETLGIGESVYHHFSAIMGTLAGTAMLAGLALLIVRRAGNRRVRATTRTMDVTVLALLAVMVATGMWNTTVHNLIEGGYDYRQTISPWFRGLALLAPDPSLATAAAVPLSYQLHAIAGWLVFMVWPFSRLVHAWSVPLAYLRRAPIVYRSRSPLGALPSSRSISGPARPRRTRRKDVSRVA
ncbi:MAG: respiratory nitrate reductase subunit gamma [Acidobacteriota bacterium]|nr:respiratory nitrate reductase subunit gamma [Acidobacteriota bacterium]